MSTFLPKSIMAPAISGDQAANAIRKIIEFDLDRFQAMVQDNNIFATLGESIGGGANNLPGEGDIPIRQSTED